jgi:hypothetical protein
VQGGVVEGAQVAPEPDQRLAFKHYLMFRVNAIVHFTAYHWR